MNSTLITTIVSMFINSISDKSKAKQVIETILNYANSIMSSITDYLKNGYLPAVVTTGLPTWATLAISMIPKALKLIPNEADIQAFLTPIIESLTTELNNIETAINAAAAPASPAVDTPVTLTSVSAVQTKLTNGSAILSKIPNTAHQNVPILKKVFDDLESLVSSILPEVVELLAKKA